MFELDDEGNFTGKWSTPDDQTWENFRDEDVGFSLENKLDGLGLLLQDSDDDSKRMFLDADNASVTSYKTACGVPKQLTIAVSDPDPSQDQGKGDGVT